MRRIARLAATVFASTLLAFALHADQPSLEELLADFPKAQLAISTPDARQHRFDIWVATTDAHRAQGLMFIRELPPDAGMLFVYAKPRTISMWMKNTFIPLDMVFIRADGHVAQVAANATPQSLKTISSKEEVPAVLELKAGTAKKLGIRAGAIVDTAILAAAVRQSE